MKEIVVIPHNIRSLHNVGSIFRTADAAGVSKVYLCGITPEPVDRFGRYREQVSKVALGAEKAILWEHVRRASALLKKLKKSGYKIFAVEQSKKSIPYYKVNLTKSNFVRLALVMGNEVRGLPKGILSKSDRILEIPMRGKKESLNVSVAFGIVVFRLVYNKEDVRVFKNAHCPFGCRHRRCRDSHSVLKPNTERSKESRDKNQQSVHHRRYRKG